MALRSLSRQRVLPATANGSHSWASDCFSTARKLKRQFLRWQDWARLRGLVVVAGDKQALVLTSDGELVEAMDLSVFLRESIERVGTSDDRVILKSGDALFRSDAEISVFEPWGGESDGDIAWSSPSSVEAEQLAAIQTAYRGRGLSVERVILDLHSGRVFSMAGRLLLDIVAILMVVLSLTGIFLSRARNRRQNGNRSQVTRPPVT